MRIHSLRRVPETNVPPAVESRSDRLGDLLVARGALTPEQADQTARAQRGTAARFGETAVGLGFAAQAAVDAALANQFDFAVTTPALARLDPSLVTAHGSRDRSSELVRGLRAKLWQQLGLAGAGNAPVVMLASMTAGVGRRVIAGNLAVSFAQAGVRTLLIDADMRSPALHLLFRCTNQSGLSNFLARREPEPAISGVDEIAGLSICSAGPVPPNPIELLARLPAALPKLRAATSAELLLINAPPFDAADDAYLIASAAPAVLMVTRQHFTRAVPLAAAAKRLSANGATIIGSVLNVA